MFLLEIRPELKLMLVQADFAAVYFDIVQRQHDYLSQWLPWVRHAHSEQFFLDFIEKSRQDYLTRQSLVCGIFYQQQLVGNISFNAIRHTLKRVDMGYWLSQNYQGQGIISQAVQALSEYAFNQLDIEKVQVSVAVDNLASRKVCERLEMTLEGIIRNSENVNGRIFDHAVYGLYRYKNQQNNFI